MKEFFLKLLNDLYKISGLRQVENIYNSYPDNDQGQLKANRELSDLIDVLAAVCRKFPYIPEEKQKEIILREAHSDTNYTSINARVIYSWLDRHKDKFYSESHHYIAETRPPLTDEQRKEVDKLLNEYLETINNAPAFRKPVPVSKEAIEIEGQEKPKAKSIGYTPMTVERIQAKEAVSKAQKEYYKTHPYDYTNMRFFNVDGFEIFAQNLEEAREIFLMIE